MSTPHNHARVLAVLRGTWTEYLVDNGCKLTQESAEDFLASAHDALATLADELRPQCKRPPEPWGRWSRRAGRSRSGEP